jgi:4-amino-4-deoxy-L-arabinose transferase-like glycosyltransferase
MRGISTAAAVVIALLHGALAVLATTEKSVTADEILHITGGYFYNHYGDYRIHPENGILPQRWAALPAVIAGAPPPPLEDNIYWRTSDASVVAHQFFYETGHDHWPMLMAGRAMNAVFSVATGVLIFCWTRSLFGIGSGFFALGLFALCPNHLAHGALATSDAAAIFFLLAAVGAFWRHLQAPGVGNLALSAGVFGLACVAKYSAVLLLPIFVLLLAWHHLYRPAAASARGRAPARSIAVTTAAHAVAAVLIIWAFYGFRYTAFAPGVPPADHFTAGWERVLPAIGWQAHVIEVFRAGKLLPEAFLYGYAWVVQSAQARSAYLAGDYSIFGWPEFFPLAFLWKTPVAVLLAIALGGAALGLRWARGGAALRADLQRSAPLLVFFAVYWAFSLTSKLNIGHRHILPTYPVIFILLGGLAAPGVLSGWGRVVLPCCLLLGQLIASVRIAPHYLAFFNSLAGGPANGWRLLVDSSLDWGQDLPRLRTWLEKNAGAEPVYLSYFGSGEPDYYGIRARRLPFVNGFKQQQPYIRLEPGIYAISATMLVDVYSPTRGPWTLEYEKEYQQLRALEPQLESYWSSAAKRAELEREASPAQWENARARHARLRFSRLSHYLRARKPDAMIGYSVLVYRLSAAEIESATQGSAQQWRLAIEQANAR